MYGKTDASGRSERVISGRFCYLQMKVRNPYLPHWETDIIILNVLIIYVQAPPPPQVCTQAPPPENFDGEAIEDDRPGSPPSAPAAPKPTSLQQRMLALSGQNIDDFMKEMEEVHRKRERDRAADLNARCASSINKTKKL